MSRKLTVITFARLEHPVDWNPLKCEVQLTSEESLLSPASKPGNTQKGSDMMAARRSDAGQSMMEASERLQPERHQMDGENLHQDSHSMKPSILVEYFPFDSLEELHRSLLQFQFIEDHGLGFQSLKVPFSAFKELGPLSFAKSTEDRWSALFTSDKNTLVIRLVPKDSRLPVDISERDLINEVGQFYHSNQFDSKDPLKAILRKACQYVAFREDEGSNDDKPFLTEEEIKKLKEAGKLQASTESPQPLSESDSEDEKSVTAALNKKFKAAFSSLLPKDQRLDVSSDTNFLSFCDSYRNRILGLFESSKKPEEMIHILYLGAVEFMKLQMFKISYEGIWRTLTRTYLTGDEKMFYWNSLVLMTPEMKGIQNEESYDDFIDEDREIRHRKAKKESIIEVITSNSSRFKLTNLYLLMDYQFQNITTSRLVGLLGYYEKTVRRGFNREDMRDYHGYKPKEEKQFVFPLISHIIDHLDYHDVHSFIDSDTNKQTTSFVKMFDLVETATNSSEGLLDQLMTMIFRSGKRSYMDMRHHKGDKSDKKKGEDLLTHLIRLFLKDKYQELVASRYIKQAMVKSSNHELYDLTFDCIYNIAAQESQEDGNFTERFSEYLFYNFGKYPHIIDILKELLRQKARNEYEYKHLGAFILATTDVNMEFKKEYVKQVIRELDRRDPNLFNPLKAIILNEKTVICSQKGMTVTLSTVLELAEDVFKENTKIWKNLLDVTKENPIEAAVHFAESSSEISAKKGFKGQPEDVFVFMLGSLFVSNPIVAKQIEDNHEMVYARVVVSLNTFLKVNAQLDTMTNQTIFRLANLKDKVKNLEEFEEKSEQPLSARLKLLKDKENQLNQAKQTFENNLKMIEESDSRVKALAFFSVAQSNSKKLMESYLSWTPDQVAKSTEYKDLIELTKNEIKHFKNLKNREPFIRELCSKEATTCEAFIKRLVIAKDQLKNTLNECIQTPEKMTIKLVEDMFPRILSVEDQKYEEMLTNLGIEQKHHKKILDKSLQLMAAKHILEIINLQSLSEDSDKHSCLERLAQLLPFKDSKDVKAESKIIKGFDLFRTSYKKLPLSEISSLNYLFLENYDKEKLREMENFQYLDCKFLEDFSLMKDLIEFLKSDIKEKKLLDKLNQDLDNTKWDLRNNLEDAYKKLEFLLIIDTKKSPEILLTECLKLCRMNVESNTQLNQLINFMKTNLARFKHEMTKATGEFKDIIASMMNDCIFMLELDTESHLFKLTAKALDKTNYKDSIKDTSNCNLTDVKLTQEEFRGNFYKVGFYNSEELNDHLTKARILNEDTKKLGETTKDKDELKKFEDIKNLVEVSVAVESIQKSLLSLFDTGLINRNFESQLIKNLKEDKNFKGFIEVIDNNTKFVFHIKNRKFGLLPKIEEILRKKSESALNSYLDLIKKDENFLMTYFVQEKMDMLIKWLSLKEDEKFNPEFRGIIGILQESLNMNQTDLNKWIKEECKTNNLQEVYALSDAMDSNEKGTFNKIAEILSKMDPTAKNFNQNNSLDNLSLGSKVSYIDAAHINQYQFILKLFMKQSINALAISQILYCTETISKVELSAFLNRCFRDKLKRVYIILNPAGLTQSRLNTMIEFIEENSGDSAVNKQLIILNNLKISDSLKNAEIFQRIEKETLESFQKAEDKLLFEKTYFGSLESIKMICSNLPGDGKTSWIKSKHQENKSKSLAFQLIEISLAGEVTRSYIELILAGLEKAIDKGKFDLHIKVDYIDRFKESKDLIDNLLFNICFIRKFELKGKTVDLRQSIHEIFIEIGNSIRKIVIDDKQLLVLSLLADIQRKESILKEVPRFNKDDIRFEENSDLMKAAQYLSLIESGQAHKILDLAGNMQLIKDKAKYQNLLFKNFKKIKQEFSETYYNFNFWVRVFVNQASRTMNWLLKIKAGELTGGETALAKRVDINELAKELLFESVESAIAIVKLHSTSANEKQKLAKEIYDLHADTDKLATNFKKIIEKEGELKRMIEEADDSEVSKEGDRKRWYTDDLFFSVVVDKDFVPIVGSSEVFNKRALDNAEKATPCGIALSTKRYFAYMKENFMSKVSDIGEDPESDDHKWYTYCLAQVNFSSERKQEGISYELRTQENFKRLLEETKKFQNNKGFILTKLTYMKLCLMILKAELRTPIIIMGESGCGKTYLSQFLVEKVCEDKLKFISLYSGFEEQELIYQILEAICEANELAESGKKLWIFFDEFNTTPLQGLIADIMIDRAIPSYYFKEKKYVMRKQIGNKANQEFEIKEAESLKLPENICFIACCNPFLIKLKRNQEDDIGLVPNEKTSNLSHIVHPVPDRLLALVWDFGQLPEDEEKKHILNMVKAEKLFSREKGMTKRNLSLIQINKLNERMAGFIHRSHNAVRHIEERSGVSLRDIKRVFLFYEWFNSQMPILADYYKGPYQQKEKKGDRSRGKRIQPRKSWIFDSEESQEIASTICSIIICYCLKLNGQKKHQKELFDIIHSWANLAVGVKSLPRHETLNCLSTVAEIYLHQIENSDLDIIDQNIAINVPFKENFMTLLACFAVRVPLIIVGAPGTSKTLCSSILMRIVGPEKNHNQGQLSLFQKLETCNWQVYCGSETTTPTIITRLFEKAEGIFTVFKKKKEEFGLIQKENSNLSKGQQKPLPATMDLPGIFFDELGLAEISPYNPLKVMHSKLEEFLGKIPFVSISNWRPDQSKINRMICLSRPDLTKDDLIDIFTGTLKEVDLGSDMNNFLRIAIEKLSECYLRFREWQKHTSPNGMYHKNFHGSRDIYATVKKIVHDLRKVLDGLSKEEAKGDESTFWKDKILADIKISIERNLNGEIYKFYRAESRGDIPIDCIRVGQLYNCRGKEVVSSSVIQAILTEDYLKKKHIESLDEFLDIENEIDLKPDVTKDRAAIGDEIKGKKIFALTSAEVFKLFFMNLLLSTIKESSENSPFKHLEISDTNSKATQTAKDYIQKFINDTDVNRLIKDNITTAGEKGIDCRFIALRTEGNIVDDLIIEQIVSMRESEYQTSRQESEMTEDKEKNTKKKGVIDLRASSTSGKVEDILSQLKTYISEGNIVIMKNQDKLYAGLYELFNQKYNQGRCYLYYGQTPQPVSVHPDFKCIVILPTGSNIRKNNQIEKLQPAPFLNRFEKYYISINNVISKGYIDLVRKKIAEARALMKENSSYFMGFNLDTLFTMIVKEEVAKRAVRSKGLPTEGSEARKMLDKSINEKFTKLLTTQYFIDKFIPADQMKLIKETHDNKVFSTLLKKKDEEYKAFIFTFSGSKKLAQTLVNSDDNEDWVLWHAADIAKGGDFFVKNNCSTLLEAEKAKRQVHSLNLIVSFELASDYDIIRLMKNLIDNQLEDSVNSVLFFIHVARSSLGRLYLRKPLGISYWNNWDIMTIDSLDPLFSYEKVFKIKKFSAKDMILEEKDDENEDEEEIIEEDGDEDEMKEKNGDEKMKKVVLINDLGDRVLRRVLITVIESIASQQKDQESTKNKKPVSTAMSSQTLPKEFDFKVMREWLDIRDRNQGKPYELSSKFVAIIAKVIRECLPADRDETASGTKSESYTDLEYYLGQVFYATYQNELHQITKYLNNVIQNFSTFVKGVSFFDDEDLEISEKETVVEEYFDILQRSASDLIEKFKKSGKIPSENALKLNQKVLYLPFRENFKNIALDFEKEKAKFDPEQTFTTELKSNSVKLYRHILSLNNTRNAESKLDQGTKVDKQNTSNLIRQREIPILAATTRLVTNWIEPRLESLKIDLNTDKKDDEKEEIARFKSMLVIDWLNSLTYKTFKDEYTFETLSLFIEVCSRLTNTDLSDVKQTESNFIKKLAATTIISMYFPEISRYILNHLSEDKSTVFVLLEKILKDESTLVNYAGLLNLESKIATETMKVDMSQVSIDDIRHLAASLEMSKGTTAEFLGLMHRMIAMLPEEAFKKQLDELRREISTEGSINYERILVNRIPVLIDMLLNMKNIKKAMPDLDKEIKQFESQKTKLDVKQTEYLKHLIIRKNQLTIDYEKIPYCATQFIEIWIEKRRNLDILMEKNLRKCLVDKECLPNFRALIVKSMKVASDWTGNFWMTTEWDNLTKKIKESGSEQHLLNEFLVNSFKDPSFKNSFIELMEILFIKISERYPHHLREKDDFNKVFERAVKTFKSSCKAPGLLFLISVVIIRAYFSKTEIDNINGSINKPTIDQVVCKAIAEKPAEFLNNLFTEENYPFVYFMQTIRYHKGDLKDVKNEYHAIDLYSNEIAQRRDETQIIVRDEDLNKEYSAFKDQFRLHLISYASSDATTKTNAARSIVELMTKQTRGSQDTSLYLFGILLINTILRSPKSPEDVELMKKELILIKSFFDETMKQQQEGTKLQQICQLMSHLSDHGDCLAGMEIILDDPNASDVLSCKKLISMMALLVICFNKMAYKPGAWKNWKTNISTENLRCIVGVNLETETCLNVLEERIVFRLSDTSYHDYGATLTKNLGIYVCNKDTCGFPYSVDNCGYTVMKSTCVWCKKEIGGTNHTTLSTQTQFKDFDPFVKYMKEKSDRAAKNYLPHLTVDPGSAVYRLLRLFELGFQALVDNKDKKSVQLFDDFVHDLYFRHLFDHLYLASQKLLMPKSNWPAFESVASSGLNLNDNSSNFSKLAGGKIKCAQDYFLVHIKNDTEKIAEKLNFNPKTKVFDWLRAVMGRMGEMIINNEKLDERTKLYIDRNIFSQAENVISLQNKISLERSELSPHARAAAALVSRDINNVDEKIAKRDSLLFLKSIFRIEDYSKERVYSDFESKLASLAPKCEVLRLVQKYQALLIEFPRLLAAVVEMSRYVHKEFSGKITLAEAQDNKIKTGIICSKKSKLQELFEEFKAAIKRIKIYKGNYEDIFKFGVACQNNLAIDAILDTATNDDTANLYHFIIPGGAEDVFQEQLAIKAVIMTMVERIHNMIAEKCNSQLSGIFEESQTMKEEKTMDSDIKRFSQVSSATVGIRNATFNDFIYLPEHFDMRKIVFENSSFDTEKESDNCFFIDFDKINLEVCRILQKPLISAQSSEFEPFDFKCKQDMNATHREVKRFFIHASEEQLDGDKQIIQNHELHKEKGDINSNLKSYIDLVSTVCKYLHTGLKYMNFDENLFEVLEGCAHEDEFKEKIMKDLEAAFDVLKIDKDEFLVGDLKKFYQELQNMTTKIFIESNCCNEVDEETQKIALKLKDLAYTYSDFRDWMKTIRDQMYEAIYTIYPKVEHLKMEVNALGEVSTDEFTEKTTKLPEGEEKELKTEFLNDLDSLLNSIKFDQWHTIEELLK